MVERTRVAVGIVLVVAAGLCVGVGSASASTGGEMLYSHDLADERTADQHLGSGGLYWQGQSLWLEDPNDEVDSEQLLLREYNLSTNNVGSVVRTIEFDNNEAVIESDELTGTYVLVPTDSRDRVITIEDGIVAGTATVDDATPFEFLEQTLDVQWEPGQVGTTAADRGIDIESNRARYNVNVSSPELSFAELEAIFMGERSLRDDNEPFGDRRPFEQRNQMYDAHADDDVIVLRGFSDGSLSADFSAVESFPEVFTVEVTDTGVARSTALPSDDGAGPFSFTALSVDEQVEPGESVGMAVTIENTWPTTETSDVVFELGGTTSTFEAELEPGEETTVSSSLTASSTAEETDYRISTSGDEVSGTVTVGDPTASADDESGDDGDDSDDDDADSGILGTIIGLLFPQALIGLVMTLLSVGAFVVWRRR